MITNTTIEEGSVVREYPKREGNGKTGPDFPWTRDLYGRAAKYFIGRIAADICRGAESIEVTRKFKAQGITATRLHAGLTQRMPWFSGYYFWKTGRHLTPKIVYQRFHKMFYENENPRGKRAMRSREHYLSLLSSLRSSIESLENLYLGRLIVTELMIKEKG